MPERNREQIDRRILRTRQLIKDAFIDLLQDMDIEKMSISRIAERATINRVTFYLHYRDIPDMLNKMSDEMIHDIVLAMNGDPDEGGAAEGQDSLKLLRLLEHIAEHSKFYKVVLGSRRAPIFTERLLRLLTELISARIEELENEAPQHRAVVQKDIAIWYGSSALIGTIAAWLRHDMPYTPSYLAKQFYLLITKMKKETCEPD